MRAPRFEAQKKKDATAFEGGVGKSNVMPLEEFDEIAAETIEGAERELEMIAPSLQDLARRIQREQPDAVVFLDMSARIFGSPYKKYLSESMGSEAPQVHFYNDNDLKAYHYTDRTQFIKVAKEDFAPQEGKKIFFVDETFSHGKGAVALLEASAAAGVDAYYIALTKDPAPVEELMDEGRDRNVARYRSDGRITVYDNPLKDVFSRFASRLYVQDFQGETLSPHKQDKPAAENNIPDANKYSRPPAGMTIEEYNKELSVRTMRLVGQLKDRIYDTLMAEEA
ncbi:MAG TPA: hypothetical protein VGB97_01990 [Candidatus Paceibacterota bacterium]|jgi:orotate phosphoribosyltransferase-like protein